MGKPSKLSEKENIDWVPNQNMGYKSTNATPKEKLEQVHVLKDGNEVNIKQKKELPSTENCNKNAEPTLQPSEKEIQMKDKHEDTEPILQPSEEEIQTQDKKDEIIAKLSKDLIYANSKIYELRDLLKNYKFDLEWLKNYTE